MGCATVAGVRCKNCRDEIVEGLLRTVKNDDYEDCIAK